MEQYLIDTNVVSDYLSASFDPTGMMFMDKVINAVPNISIISQIELLCWNTDEVTTLSLKEFIADCNVLNISSEVIAQCILIRKGKKIKTPDAIIAATALAFRYSLISSNEKDFANIPGLKFLNPQKL